MYSFGLVRIFAFGGGDMLILDSIENLQKRNVSPEQEIVTRYFAYFGLVPEGLFKQVDSEMWRDALKDSSAHADKIVMQNPDTRFERWGESLGPEGLNMMSGMTNLDPTARPTIDQVLAHPWWQGGT